MTVGRHIVHESLFDQYVEKLAAKADSMHVGDPAAGQVHLGPLIDEVQRDRVHASCRTRWPGRAAARRRHLRGALLRPTVLANTPRDAAAYCDEVFGPVASVVSFATDEEAVALASETDYGLSLGIVTADVFAGLRWRSASHRNRPHQRPDRERRGELPVRRHGRFGNGLASRWGAANIDAFTETRWITLRRQPGAYPL